MKTMTIDKAQLIVLAIIAVFVITLGLVLGF